VAGIKWTAEPVEQLLVFCVLRIVNSLQEVVVAKDATAVFWRTGVLSIQANRTRGGVEWGADLNALSHRQVCLLA
jgi:hypothetical protein